MARDYPPSRVIAVDVDGTLHTCGVMSESVVAFCRARKAAGYSLILWSARGTEYARRAAEHYILDGLFDAVVGKPRVILDDNPSWLRNVRIIRNIKGLDRKENDKENDKEYQ